ncbi:MAG: 50S ribosomal protein L9 [Spirochaetales bacterium]|nr:50S ribosomal protein L9 [Spirochaetales bacterium]
MGKRVKIIMSQDVINVGEEGEIREVASGYARNYLIPQKFAVPFNSHNLTILHQQKAAIEKRREEKRVKAQGLKEQLEQQSLEFTMQSGESGKLFGSITNGHIAEELQKKGFPIEKRKIEVPEHHLKQVGEYTVNIRLYGDNVAKIKVSVKAAESELAAKETKKAKAKAADTVGQSAEQSQSDVEETAPVAEETMTAETNESAETETTEESTEEASL